MDASLTNSACGRRVPGARQKPGRLSGHLKCFSSASTGGPGTGTSSYHSSLESSPQPHLSFNFTVWPVTRDDLLLPDVEPTWLVWYRATRSSQHVQHSTASSCRLRRLGEYVASAAQCPLQCNNSKVQACSGLADSHKRVFPPSNPCLLTASTRVAYRGGDLDSDWEIFAALEMTIRTAWNYGSTSTRPISFFCSLWSCFSLLSRRNHHFLLRGKPRLLQE